MTPPEKARMVAHLTAAITSLGRAVDYLNHKEEECPSCHMHKHENQFEWKAYTELTSARAKMQKWVDELTATTPEKK